MGPLHGLSVVVTRARHQSAALVELLEAAGARVIEFPVIEIVEPLDHGDALRSALTRVGEYDWLVVTSVNAVEPIATVASAYNGKVAAVGSGTAEALVANGFTVDLTPPQYVAESLLDVFPEGRGRVLVPRAEKGRDVLPEGLKAKGWAVDVVTAYRTVFAALTAEAKTLVDGADVVTFTSSSTVTAFLATGVEVPQLVACIGPVTAQTAEDNGLNVAVRADNHTAAGLVSALVNEVLARS